MADAAPIILTALMERRAFGRFDALRRAHFPPERNIVPAHLTLFHHLPGIQAANILADVKNEVRHAPAAISARAIKLHMMGRGVAYVVEAPELADLRARLKMLWEASLIPQDRQGWRPHITVQNKVSPEAAKRLHGQLSTGFRPFAFDIEGVTLWWYRGGPWEKLRDIWFRAGR